MVTGLVVPAPLIKLTRMITNSFYEPLYAVVVEYLLQYQCACEEDIVKGTFLNKTLVGLAPACMCCTGIRDRHPWVGTQVAQAVIHLQKEKLLRFRSLPPPGVSPDEPDVKPIPYWFIDFELVCHGLVHRLAIGVCVLTVFSHAGRS